MVQGQDLNHYQSKDNIYYWKNRKPDAAYWQQDIAYKINATIDENTHIISADENLTYVNNSPDTLHFIYFHLYQNAFVKGSYLDQLQKELKTKNNLGKYEAQGLGTVVSNIKVNGESTETELDNTILKVMLKKPLYPNQQVVVSMNFNTYFDNGSTRRRMKMYPAWGFMHFNGVQWFPKVCVYDRKFGWDTYQHLNKEFYGDFGVFDVTLNFASNYIVEATGNLQNRKEVLPDELREKLDIKNFVNKPMDEAPSTIIPYKKEERKSWHFIAENVHDFAFTADPSYRISTAFWNGIECVGLVQEPHAAGWQKSAQYVAKIIETFSSDIGMYAYPKMVAADAADGMEYPMLTLDGGSDPGYRGLLVHEIGHNWFYGMVGSNETYRAAMDEGFTQFLTAWGLKRIEGENLPENKPKNKLKNWVYEPTKIKDVRVYNSYLYNAINNEELPLITHSNDFHDALAHEGGYGMVYYKTATMLYNLQYVLGDSLFLASMQHYFNQWKIAHPYFEDFRSSIIQFSHVDLNWFFDEWLETTKKTDYAIKNVKKINSTDSAQIEFERIGQLQMPLDFTVEFKNGNKQSFHIPNTWFAKKTDAIVLPRWYGWSKIQPNYKAIIATPSDIKKVTIDTSNRLADINPLNNRFKTGLFHFAPSIKHNLDVGISPITNRHVYRFWHRPDLWWNPIDGVKMGWHIEGDYMRTMHQLKATIWWNSHIAQYDKYLSYKSEDWYQRYDPINFNISYQSPYSVHNTKHELLLTAKKLDGLEFYSIGHQYKPQGNITLKIFFQSFWRKNSLQQDYLIYPNEWNSFQQRPNNSLNISLTKTYQHQNGSGWGSIQFRAPMLAGNDENSFNYSYVAMTGQNYTRFKKLDIKTRIYARLGMGNNVPSESALWLAGANPESLMDNKFTRTQGFLPTDWQYMSANTFNHFQMGGGLNLRGYAGYLIADEKNGEVLIGYKGRSGASASIEVDFDDYISLHPKWTRNWLHVDMYGFADGGFIELSKINNLNEYYATTPTTNWSKFRMDAGLGMAFTIKKWGIFDKAQPLTIRLDCPMFVNRPPNANAQYTGFNYVIGINRSF